MDKKIVLDMLVEKGNGYLSTADAVKSDVSRKYLSKYVKENNMEYVANGLYLSEKGWHDQFYILHLKNKQMYFSHETALYLHNLAEREPFEISATVKPNYNATHLRKQGVKVYSVKEELFSVGAGTSETIFGNTVAVYDMERTICDIIRYRSQTEVQMFSSAMKEYSTHRGKNIANLGNYAKLFDIQEEVMRYVEVLL